MEVYTIDKKIVEICEIPLKSGGEGAIYELVSVPSLVAKIYHDISEAQKREEKILAMIKIGNSKEFHLAHIGNDIAWPLFPLYNSNYEFIGFLMQKISTRYELDDLYVYPPNKNTNITIKNRIDTLISLCDTIDRLHSIGQIFGDFNPDNIKIKDDLTVAFVDADSYHIFGSEKLYKCTVCAPGYVAPELVKACKGTTYADFTGTTFTVETDYFGLALHCFQMLMNGCHPFAWQRYIKQAGSVPAPKNLDLRVADGQTPFLKISVNILFLILHRI